MKHIEQTYSIFQSDHIHINCILNNLTGAGPKPDMPPEESFQVVSAPGMEKFAGIRNCPVVIYE